MTRKQQLLSVLALLLLVGVAKLGQELYRWYAFPEERAVLARLEHALEYEALGVILTQLRVDTLRAEIRARDEALGISRDDLDRFERDAAAGPISEGFARAYRVDLRAHNRRVAERNELLNELLGSVQVNQEHVSRFNVLADSVRLIAARLGEPYYSVPTPAELADRRGLE
jgi:hypothetical protein